MKSNQSIMKVWVVIPAYNEVDGLMGLILEVKKRGFSVLVVDDGSEDATHQIAEKYADIALRNEKNFGKGFSLRRGMEYLTANQQFDCLVTMDGDRQHSPKDLDKFIQAAASGSFFVIGNRMDGPGNMPMIRIITNKLMSWLISKAAGQKINDSQCGFRLIKREVLEKLTTKTKKFEIESEILINVSRMGYKIKSVPIESIYNKNPTSKIRPFSDTLRFLKFILKIKNER